MIDNEDFFAQLEYFCGVRVLAINRRLWLLPDLSQLLDTDTETLLRIEYSLERLPGLFRLEVEQAIVQLPNPIGKTMATG